MLCKMLLSGFKWHLSISFSGSDNLAWTFWVLCVRPSHRLWLRCHFRIWSHHKAWLGRDPLKLMHQVVSKIQFLGYRWTGGLRSLLPRSGASLSSLPHACFYKAAFNTPSGLIRVGVREREREGPGQKPPGFGLFFFLTALLSYNSHTIKFAHLKYLVQWVLQSHSCATSTAI